MVENVPLLPLHSPYDQSDSKIQNAQLHFKLYLLIQSTALKVLILGIYPRIQACHPSQSSTSKTSLVLQNSKELPGIFRFDGRAKPLQIQKKHSGSWRLITHRVSFSVFNFGLYYRNWIIRYHCLIQPETIRRLLSSALTFLNVR